MKWILFVAKRFLTQRNRRGEGIITLFPIIGIALGIITLVTVVGIMNGFQLGFIENILEVYSYHAQIHIDEKDESSITNSLNNAPHLLTVVPFKESFSLVKSSSGNIEGASIRGVDLNKALSEDTKFEQHVDIIYGSMPELEDEIVLGTYLARRLGISPGDVVTITGTGSSRDSTIVMPINKQFIVSGIFETGYYQYDSGLMFIPIESFNKLFPEITEIILGIKLSSPNRIHAFTVWWNNHKNDGITMQTWKELNKSFFSALAVEKLLMILVVSLIFLVVSINLFHSIRRSILERKEDLSTLRALGARTVELRMVILMEGGIIGLLGSVLGAPLSLLLVVHINTVLSWIENTLFSLFSFLTFLFPQIVQTPSLFFFSSYPVRVLPLEYIMSLLFGLLAPVVGALIASKDVLALYPVEVLHYE